MNNDLLTTPHFEKIWKEQNKTSGYVKYIFLLY